jgi:hypothetical protein
VPASPPAVARDEVDILVRRAGLNLNAGQKADLAVSYQQIVALAGRIPRARPIWDEPCFTVAPGSAEPAPAPAPTARPRAAKPAAKPPPRPAKATRPPSKPARAKPAKKLARTAKPARKAARPRR